MKSPRIQLYAWYSFAVASEALAGVGIGMFMPLVLEDMARRTGYWAPDLTVPCSTPLEGATICRAKILGRWIDTASFSMYAKSTATFIQTFMVISVGPLADDPFWRKALLIFFSYSAAVFTTVFLFWPSDSANPSLPLLGATTFIIVYCSYVIALVCANAFLPILSRKLSGESASLEVDGASFSPEDLARRDPGLRRGQSSERDRLLGAGRSQSVGYLGDGQDRNYEDEPIDKPEGAITLIISRISTIQLGIGLIASLVVNISLQVLLRYGLPLTFILGLLGIWSAIFSLPQVFLPGGQRHAVKIGSGFQKISRVVKSLRRLGMITRMLVVWLIATDAFHTMPITFIMYGSTRLHMPPSHTMALGMTAMGMSIPPTLLLPRVQRYFKFSNISVTATALVVTASGPAWGALGLLREEWGLSTEWKMFASAVIVGLSYGIWFSYARAVYGEMIPKGHESSFYSLFALADRSSSFLGPLLVGLITQTTGSFPLAWLLLLCMAVGPLPLLLSIDSATGVEQAKNYEEGIEVDT